MASHFVQAVKKYAEEHYEKDGWDFIVECWEDSDIEEEISRVRTEAGAIKKIGKIAKLCDDLRKDIRSTRF